MQFLAHHKPLLADKALPLLPVLCQRVIIPESKGGKATRRSCYPTGISFSVLPGSPWRLLSIVSSCFELDVLLEWWEWS
jgi:hypothetical protein